MVEALELVVEKETENSSNHNGPGAVTEEIRLVQMALQGLPLRAMTDDQIRHPYSVLIRLKGLHAVRRGKSYATHKAPECKSKHLTLEELRQIAKQENAFKEKELLKQQRSEIFSDAAKKLEAMLSQATHAEQLAAIDFIKHQATSTKKYPYEMESVTKLFQNYLDALQNGEKKSFNKLAQASGIKYSANARQILNRNGFSSLYWSVESYKSVSPLELEFAKALHTTPLRVAEMIRLTPFRRSKKTLEMLLSRIGERPWASATSDGATRNHNSHNSRVVDNYAIAADVYEAQDIGFSVDEISQLLNISVRRAETYLKVRSQAEPQIKNVQKLGKLYTLLNDGNDAATPRERLLSEIVGTAMNRAKNLHKQGIYVQGYGVPIGWIIQDVREELKGDTSITLLSDAHITSAFRKHGLMVDGPINNESYFVVGSILNYNTNNLPNPNNKLHP